MSPTRIVTTPLVDALGSPAWDIMQRRTTILFDREVPQTNEACRVHPDEVVQGPLYKLGVALTNELADLSSYQGLVLIGHSMGAILGTEFLRRFPGLHFDNIVFMAAACSVRDVVDGVYPYLADHRNQTTRFYNLVLHPQADTRESPMAHIAPEGSLLVWLDQFLDKPDSILDRRAGRYVNLGLNAPYLEQEAVREGANLASRIYIKTFPYDSRSRSIVPMHHGDFSEFIFWDPSFWDPASNGPYKMYAPSK